MLKRIIEIMLLVFNIFIISIASADLNTGLVAYWNFDDCTAKDITGHGYDGTIHGTQCVNGIVGKALLFNGVTDYIDITVPINGSKNWTICSWLNIKVIDPNYTDWQATISSDTFELGFKTGTSELSIWNNGDMLNGGNNNISKEKNTFICYQQKITNSISTLSIFKNGKLLKKGTGNTEFSFLSTIGMWQKYAPSPFEQEPTNGLIDEVRIYNRALSSTEISSIYNQGVSINGTINGMANHTVTCFNATTSQLITIPASIASVYDCESKGLIVNLKDHITITIDGNK